MTSNTWRALGATALLCSSPPALAAGGATPVATDSGYLDPATAMGYSALLPGAGQAYAGEWGRGAFFFVLAAGFTSLLIAGYVISPQNSGYIQTGAAGMIVLSAIAPIDAYFLVRDRNQKRLDEALRTKGKALPR